MLYAVVIIAVVASIVLSVLRGKKIKERREEEERRRQERMRSSAPPTPPVQRPAQPSKPRVDIDPFPSYRPDPFANAQGANTGTLSPAQLNEWLIDFTMAEQAGVDRPPKKDTPSKFARYLHSIDFSYRELRKRSGYTPQNLLTVNKTAQKRKPSALSTVLRNTYGFTARYEQKLAPADKSKKQYVKRYAEPAKAPARHDKYESFYKDKN